MTRPDAATAAAAAAAALQWNAEAARGLRGRLAAIVESQRGATFIDVARTEGTPAPGEDGKEGNGSGNGSGSGGFGAKVYAVTAGGMLCAFNAATASIESFVSLEAPTAYSSRCST